MQITFSQVIDLEQDLAAYYLFEGDARNQLDDDKHGIETNVQYTTDRLGNTNSAIYLSGENSYITIPHTEDLNWDARSESYSILFWVRATDPKQGLGVRIISKWNEIVANPYPFAFPVGDRGLTSQIREANTSPLYCRIDDIWNDQWHHIAMVYNHEIGEMRLYFNAQLADTKQQSILQSTRNSFDIKIGRTFDWDVYYKGFIDDLYFYDRAITLCEIEALHSGLRLEER